MKNYVKIIFFFFSISKGQTDLQIKKAKDYIKNSGMSKEEVIRSAKSYGYSEDQVKKAIAKEKLFNSPDNNEIISPILDQQNTLGDQAFEEIVTEKNDNSSPDDEASYEEDPIVRSKPLGNQVPFFGYDIFNRDPSLFQSSSVGVVDPEYLIGPGDEIIVMLWGETQFRQVFPVDREGFIFVPEIGQVFVNGLNLSLLESKLFRVFSQSYASLNPSGRSPTTFLDISLGNLRPLRIQVLGEVAQPGAYTVNPSTTLFSALYYFNGPTKLGSLRDIHLIRAGEKVSSIDFYDFLLTGKKPKDEKLQLDDVIYIPNRLKTVTITGEISRSGIYELKSEENLNDLIEIAGGLKITAYLNRSQIDRIVPFQDREIDKIERVFIDINLGKMIKDKEKIALFDGDRIIIESILDNRNNVVELIGSVLRPGKYEYADSLKISELIEKGEGLLGDAYLKRLDLIRTRSDLSKELLKFDLQKVMDGVEEHDIFLQPLDQIVISGMNDLIGREFVFIEGHVRRPGQYILIENMRITDLLFQAGGYVDDNFKNQTHLERADLIRLDENNISRSIISFNLDSLLKNQESEINLKLLPFDKVRVYNKNVILSDKPVSIFGIVRAPGLYSLKTDMNLKDLIFEAGGLKENVYRYKIDIARLNPLNKDVNKLADSLTYEISNDLSVQYNSEFSSNEKRRTMDIADIKLEPYDLITVRADPFFSSHKQVEIIGEVLYPGFYTILSSKEKITSIVKRAGGLKENANLNASSFIRNDQVINIPLKILMRNPKSNQNIIIQDGDKIIITPYSNIVSIQGAINSPGLQKYIVGKRLSHYIELSGGFSPNADKKNIWVEYPNGVSKQFKKWAILSPKILDGSKIFISTKPDEAPFDLTEFLKEATAIAANLAQALAVVVIAGK